MKQLGGYDFGDCEVRRIDFEISKVTMRIYRPSDEAEISIYAEGVLLFSMDTNLPQNVLQSLTELNISNSNKFVSTRMMDCNMDVGKLDRRLKVIYAEPIAGAEIAIVCKKYKVSVTNRVAPAAATDRL
ncbi:hypothetical protein ACWGS9_32590 [Bradyrhizobium sp. Arg314]